MKAELNARFLTCWPLCASAGPSLPPSYCATLVNQKWQSKWTPDALQLQNMQHVATTSCANWHVQLWITTSHVFQSTKNLLLPAWTKSWSGFSELTFQRNTGSQGWVSLCSIGATRKKDLAGEIQDTRSPRLHHTTSLGLQRVRCWAPPGSVSLADLEWWIFHKKSFLKQKQSLQVTKFWQTWLDHVMLQKSNLGWGNKGGQKTRGLTCKTRSWQHPCRSLCSQAVDKHSMIKMARTVQNNLTQQPLLH